MEPREGEPVIQSVLGFYPVQGGLRVERDPEKNRKREISSQLNCEQNQ
jgi:hypothetical protein